MDSFLLIVFGLIAIFFLLRRTDASTRLKRYSAEDAGGLLLAYQDRFRMGPPGPKIVPEFKDSDVMLDAVKEALRTGVPVPFPDAGEAYVERIPKVPEKSETTTDVPDEARQLLERARILEEEAAALRVQAAWLVQ
jgi:hypothetical protein